MSVTDSETILQTEQLEKAFETVTAVDGVDFDVSRGEIVGLIGPNGAGKTTFMDLITGAKTPTGGTVRFAGEEITSLPPFERVQKGIIKKYQVTNVYEDRTVRENVAQAVRGRTPGLVEMLTSAGEAAVESEVPSLLAAGNLSDERDETVATLSHGKKQWLEIVMALAVNPKLLLLDEPTSGMGPEETAETIDLLRTVRENRPEMSILVIEHDIEFIKELAERIVVLHRGEVIASGPPEVIETNERVQEVYL
jgi:ABC-type branched-subunit amino acid transport system ATPase component